MKKESEQILMIILMDLVDHELLTTEEADLAKRTYLKGAYPAVISCEECHVA